MMHERFTVITNSLIEVSIRIEVEEEFFDDNSKDLLPAVKNVQKWYKESLRIAWHIR